LYWDGIDACEDAREYGKGFGDVVVHGMMVKSLTWWFVVC